MCIRDSNSPVCSATQNLDLLGDAVNPADVDTWEWTNDGAGMIDDDEVQTTFATNAEDGETYTLTTTDINGCTSEVIQSITAAAFDAELSGGGDICINNCTDDNTDIVINISGGTAPYSASFTVNGIPVPQDVPINDINEVFRVCVDEDAPFIPSIDDSQDPILITIQPGLLPFTLELDNITDDTNCGGNIIGGGAALDEVPQPEIINPLDQELCQEPNGTIDLTTLDDIITGGDTSLEVFYFESDDDDDIINDPDDWNPTTNEICAKTFDGTCFSDFELSLIHI